MFNSIIKATISIKDYRNRDIIIIDNEKKDVLLNDKYKNLKKEEYDEFLTTFLRIIREWQNEEKKIDEHINININIIEKDNNYSLNINHYPNNYDSFIDLINTLKNWHKLIIMLKYLPQRVIVWIDIHMIQKGK